MKIDGATALVTGANRGLGRKFARQLVERGAQVCATVRKPETIDLEGVRSMPDRWFELRVAERLEWAAARASSSRRAFALRTGAQT